MFKDLVVKNRSYRRFDESFPISRETLLELVDLARQTASAANKQPLRYILSSDPEGNAIVFGHLAWAGYLPDWPGPEAGERPTGYVIMLGDRETAPEVAYDHGIAAQTILLGAVEKGLGGCMIASVSRAALRKVLAIPERYEILLVIALGRPVETVVMDPIGPDGDVKYWRDGNRVHHVPKRRLEDIVLG
jgi:nitroreductase